MSNLDCLNPFLSLLFGRSPINAISHLENESNKKITLTFVAMIRTAILLPGQSSMYYRRLSNLWHRLNCPPLKPNPASSEMLIISDSTLSGAPLLLKIFAAAYGISLNVRLSEYDSVEQQVLAKENHLNIQGNDIVLLMLSEQWLRRYLGSTILIEQNKVNSLKNLLKNIFDSIRIRKPARIIVGNFPSRSFVGPAGTIITSHYLGWSNAITHINDWLNTQVSDDLCIVDVAEAISLAGGNKALGRLSYFRARIPFEESGMITICREITSVIANILGKNHRALLTDWDNTLWGGEVGELGIFGVNTSVDNPDGLGYQLLQTYLRDLKKLGTLLASVSRNDSKVVEILDKNSDVLLKKSDFTSIQIHWGSKSDSVSKIITDFGFGSEYMVMMDDSLVELAQVLSTYPYIDLIPAGPSPDFTLARLCEGRYFNTVSVLESDLERHQRQLIIQQQNNLEESFASTEDFLRSLSMRLTVDTLTSENETRVVQLLQKTNQFNLTTRRHQINDLNNFKEKGAKFGIFSYEDDFGSQGIISVVILLTEASVIKIDTWLMSCRVLNRGIENAVFNWIVQNANGNCIFGEYLPTAKNTLVQDLFYKLKFNPHTLGSSEGETRWIFNPKENPLPCHFVEIITEIEQIVESQCN